MREPDSGYLLAGGEGEQQCYRRNDELGRTLARDWPDDYTVFSRWENVMDKDDVYTFEHMCKDYGEDTLIHLNPCQLCRLEGDDASP